MSGQLATDYLLSPQSTVGGVYPLGHRFGSHANQMFGGGSGRAEEQSSSLVLPAPGRPSLPTVLPAEQASQPRVIDSKVGGRSVQPLIRRL